MVLKPIPYINGHHILVITECQRVSGLRGADSLHNGAAAHAIFAGAAKHDALSRAVKPVAASVDNGGVNAHTKRMLQEDLFLAWLKMCPLHHQSRPLHHHMTC
jgi:hypothetical protein